MLLFFCLKCKSQVGLFLQTATLLQLDFTPDTGALLYSFYKGLLRPFDGLAVDEDRDTGRDGLGDPKRMPDARGAKQAAQHPGNGHHGDNVAHQRDDERLGALTQTLQCAGAGHGKGRYDKARANDAQCGLARGDRLRVGAEHIHQRAGKHQA